MENKNNNNMERDKEFVPYDIAIALKEIGFDNVNCLAVYTALTEDDEPEMDDRGTQYYAQKGWKGGVLCPLYQQAFRWFRDEYELCFYITSYRMKEGVLWYRFVLNTGKGGGIEYGGFILHQEAQDACLRKLIEIVKENL